MHFGAAFWVIAILWGIWGLFIVKKLKKIIFCDLKFLEKDISTIDPCHLPFARMDRQQWCIKEIYFGGIFLLPIRLVLMISCFVGLSLVFKIFGISNTRDYYKPLPAWKGKIVALSTNFFSKCVLIVTGFYRVPVQIHKISDYDGQYKEAANKPKRRPPISVSNHVTWTDFIYMLTEKDFPSFLAKDDVLKIPIFRNCAIGIQSLFVHRQTAENRQATIDQIAERVDKCLSQPESNVPTLHIFPEGTTTNGDYLINFKKGAFFKKSPIKIVCLKYGNRHFNPALDSIGQLNQLILLLSQLSNQLQVHDIGVFDPKNYPFAENYQWEDLARVIKQIMLKCLKCTNSESSFQQKSAYYEALRKEKTK